MWIGDRPFCTRAILGGLAQRGACCIVREHTRHPKIDSSGPWGEYSDSGCVREQAIELARPSHQAQRHYHPHPGAPSPWRRIEISLHTPTPSGDERIVLWSNLPAQIDAGAIARLYRQRWCIKGLFGRLEAVLNSEIKTLGHPARRCWPLPWRGWPTT